MPNLIHYNRYIDEYNKQMSETLTDLHENLHWVSVARDVSLSPSGIPLLPDCIHFNWLLNDLVNIFNSNNTEINQVDTHLAILDVIMNVYCSGRIEARDSKVSCCQ